MITTQLAKQCEQFQDGDAWHTGKRVLTSGGREIIYYLFDGAVVHSRTLFRLGSGVDVLVDPAKLSP